MDSRDTVPARTQADGGGIWRTVALVLLIVGGINWGLVGLFNIDLVAALFGSGTSPSRVVYVLVGIAALAALGIFPRLFRR
jgi:uncharacterized membrane protein YuzA (DUF378 family)